MSRWLGGERRRPPATGAPARARLRTDDPVPAAEAQRRLEQARERLKATIPPPADDA